MADYTKEDAMLEDYYRIEDGEVLNIINIPYSISYMKLIRTYLEKEEMFEECIIITNKINNYLDHDNNYIKPKHTF